MAPFSALQVANSGYSTYTGVCQLNCNSSVFSSIHCLENISQVCHPSLPLANYLHNKIFPDFARFSLLFFAPYVIIIM